MSTFRDTAIAIIAAIRADDAINEHLHELFVADGRLPNSSEASHPRYDGVVVAALERFSAELFPLVQIALTYALESDDHFAAIRRFFLDPQEAYSLDELAALWRVRTDDVRDIYHDQIARAGEPLAIGWADAVGTTVAYSLLRPHDIERALGQDLTRVRSARWRTVPVLIHLPRFVADAFTLDASMPPRLALAARIEQFVFELFATEQPANSTSAGMPP